MNARFFGVLSGIFSGVSLFVIQFLLKINILFIDEVGKIPFFVWLIFVVIFLLFSLFVKSIKRKTVNWLYLVVAIISFVYLNSLFQWSVNCCPEQYDSMSDWNASKGLSWIVSVPITFMILLIQGMLYDFLPRLIKAN